jgi:hypothetical protein
MRENAKCIHIPAVQIERVALFWPDGM